MVNNLKVVNTLMQYDNNKRVLSPYEIKQLINKVLIIALRGNNKVLMETNENKIHFDVIK